MKQYTKTQTLLISLAICLVLATCMFFAILNIDQIAYADYIDIVSNPTTLVNYNQLIAPSFNNPFSFNNSIIYGSVTANTSYTIANIGRLNSSHKYYLHFINGVGFYSIQITNNMNYSLTNDVNWVSGEYSNIFTSSSNTNYYNYDFYLTTETSGPSFSVSIYFIDLTLMFGVGNEPNIQQCEDLFVAGYYPYNTGTAISLSSLNGYAEGYNDALSSFSIIESSSDIIDSIYKVNARLFDKIYNPSSGATRVLLQDGIMGIPVGFTLSPNDVVTFDISRMVLPDYNPNGTTPAVPFDVGYLSGGNFVTIASYSYQDFTSVQESGLFYYTGSFTITIPVSTNAIYFRITGSNSSGTYYSITLYNFTMTIRSINLYSAITDGVNNGIREAKNFYDSYYSVGGIGYNQIFNLGKTAGINENNPYTFGYLMSSVIEAPLNAVLSIFNFDFLGYNFKNVITLVLTVMLICAIIRLFMGGN